MIRKFVYFVSILCALHCSAQDSLLTFQLEAPNTSNAKELNIWATEYYAHVTKSQGTIPYLTPEGDSLGFYSDSCDFCTACLEGTVIIEDSQGERHVLNYAGRANAASVNCRLCPKYAGSKLNVESWGSVRWKRSSQFGEGVKGYFLIPYRTIAVDPNVIPYGSVVFIPEAIGTAFTDADGTTLTHDGYFFAGDTGGAIKKNHIDVYTGIDDSHPFDFVKSTSNYTVKAYIIQDESLSDNFTNLHRK